MASLRLLIVIAVGITPVMAARPIHAADQPGIISSQFIFDPAPHPQCHASTVAETPSGLVAA